MKSDPSQVKVMEDQEVTTEKPPESLVKGRQKRPLKRARHELGVERGIPKTLESSWYKAHLEEEWKAAP